MKAEDSPQADTGEEESGQNPEGAFRGTKADVTTRLRTNAELAQESGRLDAVCERGNLKLPYRPMVDIKGAAGVDGIGVAEFKDHPSNTGRESRLGCRRGVTPPRGCAG